MARVSDNVVSVPGIEESLEALASKLPEADALPDGFSEGLTETITEANVTANTSKPVTYLVLENTDAVDETSRFSEEIFKDLCIPDSKEFCSVVPDLQQASDLAIGSQRHNSLSRKNSNGSNEPFVSPGSSLGEIWIEREKTRRFPVQLSEKEIVTAVEYDSGKDTDSFDQNSEDSKENVDSKLDININVSPGKSFMTVSEGDHVSEILDSELKLLDGGHLDQEDDKEQITTTKKEEVQESGTREETESCFTKSVQQINSETSSLGHPRNKKGESRCEDEVLTLRHDYKQMKKERDLAKEESAKAIMLREKLESLCRELQRQNKQLTVECQRVTSEEQQKRLDLSDRFHTIIKDVTTKLEEQENERLRQTKENEMLREKLSHFIQQYELREKQFAQELKAKSLELQLSEMKLKQQEVLVKQEEEKNRLCTERISHLLKTEQELRAQLTVCGDNFQQFQDTLVKSNEVFASYKKEIEKMSKAIKILEKENVSLRKKCKEYDLSFIELLEEKEALRKQLESKSNQKEKLEALCRLLQAERKPQSSRSLQMATASDIPLVEAGASFAVTVDDDMKQE